MKRIIPFNKELLLSTKISEVTSISLEHDIALNNDNIISGNFIVTGDYKMTASSINREKFSFTIPVEVSLSDNSIIENAVIDIDNFYYEIINDDSIKVNIDLSIDVIEKNNKENTIVLQDNEISDESIILVDDNKIDERDVGDDFDNLDEVNNKLLDKEIEPSVLYKETNTVDMEGSLDDDVDFFNIDNFNNDTYATYYVYIVKEDDTLEKILDKFKVSKDDLVIYNDVKDIKRGNKLIIPINNEQ